MSLLGSSSSQVLSELWIGAGARDVLWRRASWRPSGRLQPHLPPPAALAAQCLSLRKGQLVDLRRPADTLQPAGLRSGVPTIEQEGSWKPAAATSFDVFPVSAELPVRLEFFGSDTLEKLREFDPGQPAARSIRLRPCVLTPTGLAPWWPMPCGPRIPMG